MSGYLSALLTVIILLSGFAFAENNTVEQKTPPSIEELNKDEARENVSNRLQELSSILLQSAKKKYNDCLKAFGDHRFCECLQNKTPSGINLSEYVAIVIHSKEELGYSKADEETKGIIDNTLKARETCVGE